MFPTDYFLKIKCIYQLKMSALINFDSHVSPNQPTMLLRLPTHIYLYVRIIHRPIEYKSNENSNTNMYACMIRL